MEIADELIERARNHQVVPIDDDLVLLSTAERESEVQGWSALLRYKLDRAAGLREHGIPHAEALKMLGL